MKNNEFKEKFYKRCINLTVKVIVLINSMKLDYEFSGISRQLINSISSIGANFTEGNGAVSKGEFIKFMNHARNSGLESIYWFDVFIESGLMKKRENRESIKKLKEECKELTKILGSIILTSKK